MNRRDFFSFIVKAIGAAAIAAVVPKVDNPKLIQSTSSTYWRPSDHSSDWPQTGWVETISQDLLDDIVIMGQDIVKGTITIATAAPDAKIELFCKGDNGEWQSIGDGKLIT